MIPIIKREKKNIILTTLGERHPMCIFKLCYLPMKSPDEAIPFLWKKDTPLPTSCKLTELSKNTPAHYELMVPNLKLQYHFICSLHFPWAQIYSLWLLFCKTKNLCKYLPLFSFGTVRGDSDCQRRDRMSFLDYSCIWLNSLKGRQCSWVPACG